MIRLRRLTKAFGPRVLLKDADAEFRAGAVHLVVGRNGAGKSTLLRLVAGVCRPTSGEIVLGDGSSREPRIGFLGHSTFLYPNLDALENLAFWQRASGLPAERRALLGALSRVDLAPFAHMRAALFSRGMAQRLSLARVLLAEPAVCLLDEPETGLDAASREILEKEVAAARARGACVLWVTHLARGRGIADDVFEIADRRIRPAAGAGAC